jgi:hypothetical protein
LGLIIVGVRIAVGAAMVRVLFVPIIIVVVGVPLAGRSSYRAWRAGHSPVPRLQSSATVLCGFPAETALGQGVLVLQRLDTVQPESLRAGHYEVTAETRSTGPSWGERISLRATDAPDGTSSVTVVSRPLMRTNIFDSGTNESNVDFIIHGLASGR